VYQIIAGGKWSELVTLSAQRFNELNLLASVGEHVRPGCKRCDLIDKEADGHFLS